MFFFLGFWVNFASHLSQLSGDACAGLHLARRLSMTDGWMALSRPNGLGLFCLVPPPMPQINPSIPPE